MAALQGMAAYLRTLKSFQVDVATTDEDVLDDGQKIQYSGTTTILARMPNGLRADVANDRRERMYLYDGKTFTSFAKPAQPLRPFPPCPRYVGQLADTLDEKYDVTVPIAYLFRLGHAGLEHGRHQGSDGRRPQHRRGRQLRAVRVPAGRHRLADLDPEGRPPPAWPAWATTRRRPTRGGRSTRPNTRGNAPSFNSMPAFVFDLPQGAARSFSPRPPRPRPDSRRLDMNRTTRISTLRSPSLGVLVSGARLARNVRSRPRQQTTTRT